MSVKIGSLEITGYLNRAVPNSFWRQQPESDALGILLPGLGYTADMPALFYPGRLLLHAGMDLLKVEYTYGRNPEFTGANDATQTQWLYEDTLAACQSVLRKSSYRRLVLVGKSLGTMAMANLLDVEPRFEGAECVWLTPVLTDPQVVDHLRRGSHPGLVVIGTADHYYNSTLIDDLRGKSIRQVAVYSGADHGLEVAGNTLETIHIMENVIVRIGEFLRLQQTG